MKIDGGGGTSKGRKSKKKVRAEQRSKRNALFLYPTRRQVVPGAHPKYCLLGFHSKFHPLLLFRWRGHHPPNTLHPRRDQELTHAIFSKACCYLWMFGGRMRTGLLVVAAMVRRVEKCLDPRWAGTVTFNPGDLEQWKLRLRPGGSN